MKNYKEILNHAAYKGNIRKLRPEESNALKRCVLDMYDAIANLCKKNGLMFFLGGGTCLGAIRHKGFIPWDDDLDLNMPRSDYDKLINLLENGALGDDYEFTYPSKVKDSPCLWLQIFRKDTRLIPVDGERSKFPNGCYIDIFPLEGVPSNQIFRHLKGWISNILRLIANMVMDAETPTSPALRNMCDSDKKLKYMMVLRRSLGSVFSIVSHKKWAWLFDCFARNPIISEYVGFPTGRNLFFKESHPIDVFFPLCEGVFEGRKVCLPAKADVYLKSLYGDYMIIPSEDKRESHFILDIKLPDKYFSQEEK